MNHKNVLRFARNAGLLAAAYGIAGYIGGQWAVGPVFASIAWPAAGIALAVLMTGGLSLWPGVFIGALVLGLGADTGGSTGTTDMEGLLAVVCIAAGATLQALAGAWAGRRLIDLPATFISTKRTALFLVLAGPVACILGTAAGVASLVATGTMETYEWQAVTAVWWAGNVIGTVTFGPLILLWAGARGHWEYGRPQTTWLMLIVFFTAAAAYSLGHRYEQQATLQKFAEQSERFADTFVIGMNDRAQLVDTFDIFHQTVGTLRPATLHTFSTRQMDAFPDLHALAWARYVRQENRTDVERGLRDTYGQAQGLSERTADGRLRPAAERTDYVPLTLIDPVTPYWRDLGFDISSDPLRRTLIERARDTGQAVASSLFPLSSFGSDEQAIEIYRAFYGPNRRTDTVDQRRSALRGYHVAIFSLNDLVQQTIGRRVPAAFTFLLRDAAAPDGKRQLYSSHWEGLRSVRADRANLNGGLKGGVYWSFSVPVADRTWELQLHLREDALLGELQTSNLALALTCAVLTLLIALLVLTVAARGSDQAAVIRTKTALVDSTYERLSDLFDRLMESEMRLQAAQRIGRFGFWEWDIRSGRILACSDECSRIFGRPAGTFNNEITVMGRLYDLIHPDDRTDVERKLQDYTERCLTDRKATESQELEFRVTTASGEIRSLRQVTGPLFDSQGELRKMMGTVQDITEQWESEDHLRQAHKMEALGKLTGGVAHDFNNLLFVIRGNTDLLARRIGQDDPLLNEIRVASERGSGLTKQLLAFSRRQPLNPQPVDLVETLARMQNMLQLSLGEQIDITVDTPADLWHALADQTQMENAILNIAINARDAMPDGGLLFIECANVRFDTQQEAARHEVSPGNFVVVSIRDTGAGMPAGIRSRVFEPFFTTKEVGAGSGLGLSMVYGFVKQSQGHVEILSEQGVGTTVRLILPRSDTLVSETELETENLPMGRGEAILLIEDDPMVRMLTTKMLESLNYEVVAAGDAFDAEAVLENRTVDLVLSDVVLPGGVSGPQFAQKAVRLYPGLTVIFMSGYPMDVTRHEGRLTEHNVLLNKPFGRPLLARTLRNALDTAPADRP